MHLLFIFLLVCCCFGSKSYLYNIFINLSCVLTRSTNSSYSHNYKYVHFTSLKVHPHNLRSLYLHLVPYPFISSVHFERVWVCVVMPICVHVYVCPLFSPQRSFSESLPRSPHNMYIRVSTFFLFPSNMYVCDYALSRRHIFPWSAHFTDNIVLPKSGPGKKKHEKDDHRLAQKFNLELRDEMYAAHLP